MKKYKGFTVYKFTKSVPEMTETMFTNFEFTGISPLHLICHGLKKNLMGEFITRTEEGIFLSVVVQKKTLNPFQLKTLTAAKIKLRELEADRKLAKAEIAQAKQDAKEELTQTTFPKEPEVFTVHIDKDLMYISAPTHRVAEEVIAMIRKAVGTLPVVPVNMKEDVAGVLTDMVANKEKSADHKFTLGNDLVLVDEHDVKTVFNDAYKGKTEPFLDDESLSIVTRLAVEYDGMISVRIDEDLQFSGMKFLDSSIFEDIEDYGGYDLVVFNEIKTLFKDVVKLCGGIEGE